MSGLLAAKLSVIVLGLLAAVRWMLATDNLPYVNTILNFASLAILLAGVIIAPRAFRARAAEAQLKEKDRIIETRTQLAQAAEESAQLAKDKAAELGAMLDHSREDAATWKARYDEQSQYTAAPALDAIQKLMERSEEEAKRRHREMLLTLRALRHLVPGSPSLDADLDDGTAG